MTEWGAGAEGMDFRALLKRKRYSEWDKDKGDPDWGELKKAEQEQKPMLKHVEKVKKALHLPPYIISSLEVLDF